MTYLFYIQLELSPKRPNDQGAIEYRLGKLLHPFLPALLNLSYLANFKDYSLSLEDLLYIVCFIIMVELLAFMEKLILSILPLIIQGM